MQAITRGPFDRQAICRQENRPCALVRIDLRKGKDAAYRQDVGRAGCKALVSVGVPKNDRCQVGGEYEADVLD